MPLMALWSSNPKAIGEMSIEQVVAAAGDGNLKDDSPCSHELREYLSQVPSTKIAEYIDHCLASSYNKSGFVLQDLVNELGRRLDYEVSNGRYQGTSNAIGHDGIWRSPESHTVVVEVKTTDAYRIPLDTIAGYRARLVADNSISHENSILIIVGRHDTGELEAQVRGSRHAWDIRLISADALTKLVQLKENADSSDTGRKIRNLLTPMEYTRLDDMVDVMFTTATDVETPIVEPSISDAPPHAAENSKAKRWQVTDSVLLHKKRNQIIQTFAQLKRTNLISKSRALYWSSGHQARAAITISTLYQRTNHCWYGYHTAWENFLAEGESSFFILGCMDQEVAFMMPWQKIHSMLDALNTTTTERGTYWHIHMTEDDPGKFFLHLPKRSQRLPLAEFQIPLLCAESDT